MSLATTRPAGRLVELLSYAVAALLVIAAAIAAAAVPALPISYGHGSLRTVIETTSGLVALLATFLVVDRYRRSSRLGDLVLVEAFMVLAGLNVVPAALGAIDSTLRLRLVLVGGLIAAASFVLAAVAADVELAGRRPSPYLGVAVGAAAPAGALLLVRFLHLDPGPATATTRTIDLAAALFYATASVAFVARRRVQPRTDELSRWLALGCAVAAFGRLTFALSDRVDDGALHAGDLARFAFYTLVLVGAVSEIRSYWQRLAVLEERRRLARDLHDGVAQELAFIATEARRAPELVQLSLISAAAQRALDESREAISALSRRTDQTLDDAVAEAAEEITNRIGIPLQLDLVKAVTVPAPLREELVRIVREAVANAARHANARLITVVLAKDAARLRLQVIDDGHGFDPANVRYGRAGLSTMRQRATDIGAELSIATEVGTGTVVELDLPTGGPS